VTDAPKSLNLTSTLDGFTVVLFDREPSFFDGPSVLEALQSINQDEADFGNAPPPGIETGILLGVAALMALAFSGLMISMSGRTEGYVCAASTLLVTFACSAWTIGQQVFRNPIERVELHADARRFAFSGNELDAWRIEHVMVIDQTLCLMTKERSYEIRADQLPGRDLLWLAEKLTEVAKSSREDRIGSIPDELQDLRGQ